MANLQLQKVVSYSVHRPEFHVNKKAAVFEVWEFSLFDCGFIMDKNLR
jgi:hypothetical protein